MGEYGPGLTSGQMFNKDKERIRHALNGEILCGEDENGFIYQKASKEECDKYILSTFDNAVFEVQRANTSGRALNRIIKEYTDLSEMDIFQIYQDFVMEEDAKFNDYIYETNEEDIEHEEAD